MKPSALSHFNYDLLRDFRDSEIATQIIRKVLSPEVGLTLLQGAWGVGKTTLLRTLATRLEPAFPAGVFWILPRYGSIREQVGHARRKLQEGALVIIDGADESEAELIEALPLALEVNDVCQSSALIVSGRTLGPFANFGTFFAMTESVADLFPESAEMLPGQAPIDFQRPGMVGPDGRPLAEDSESGLVLVRDARAADRMLLERLSANPDAVYTVSPRRFEELVARVYEELGYEVCLTPASKDGGRDLHVIRKDHLGSALYFVECKRYSKERRVGVGLVRQLYGVVSAERASAGVLITTSSFTANAKAFQETVPNRVSLREYSDFQRWLDEAGFKPA